jgi:hypothetical protein
MEKKWFAKRAKEDVPFYPTESNVGILFGGGMEHVCGFQLEALKAAVIRDSRSILHGK